MLPSAGPGVPRIPLGFVPVRFGSRALYQVVTRIHEGVYVCMCTKPILWQENRGKVDSLHLSVQYQVHMVEKYLGKLCLL